MLSVLAIAAAAGFGVLLLSLEVQLLNRLDK